MNPIIMIGYNLCKNKKNPFLLKQVLFDDWKNPFNKKYDCE